MQFFLRIFLDIFSRRLFTLIYTANNYHTYNPYNS